MAPPLGTIICDECGESISAAPGSGATVCRCGAGQAKSALSGTAFSRAIGLGILAALVLSTLLHH